MPKKKVTPKKPAKKPAKKNCKQPEIAGLPKPDRRRKKKVTKKGIS